jgi:aminoglycoside phosphotransferase family enzyme/predicted kinase
VGDAPQDDVIRFLSDPRSYGLDVQSIERHETHGAMVFLAGERAYKLKRAVKFPYMDYSTVELRRQMCERELAVNRRTAPDLYLEVRPIVRDRVRLRFGHSDESGEAIDWLVVMRRFDQRALLEDLRRSGGLTPQLMRLTAETVAHFHSKAEQTVDFGGEAGMRAVIDGNVAILRSKLGHPFGAHRVAEYERMALHVLDRVAALLEQRRRSGHVRRCHGDLHLNNICLLDGHPVLFDAIEFDDRFASIDVLYDLAFLLMDLDQHGLRGLANTVLNRYLEVSGQHQGLAALPLFMSCRAAIRAHTTQARAETCHDEALKSQLINDAIGLLDRAVEYLADTRSRLIAVGGVSGTGKSTLAYALAPFVGRAPGAVVVRSDVVRKQLRGVAETVHLPPQAYTPAFNRTVYERMVQLATDALTAGYCVMADAVYGSDDERMAIAEAAHLAGASFDGVWLEGPQDLLTRRITERCGDASDATPDVLKAQLGFVTVPSSWKRVVVDAPPAEILTKARKMLNV